MTIASDISLEQAKQAGLINVANIKRYSDKDAAEVQATATRYLGDRGFAGAELTAKSHEIAAKWTALPGLSAAGRGQKISEGVKGEPGYKETYTEGDPLAKEITKGVASDLGIIPPVVPNGSQRSIEGETNNAVERLKAYNAAGDTAGAKEYVSMLDPQIAASARDLLKIPQAQAAPAVRKMGTTTLPAAPQESAPTPIIQPARQVLEPFAENPRNRNVVPTPIIQTPVPPAAGTPATAGPLGTVQTAFSPSLPSGSPARAAGKVLGSIWNRGSMQTADIIKRRKEEDDAIRAAKRVSAL